MHNHAKKLLTTLVDRNHAWKLTLFEKWDSIIGSMKDKVRIEKISQDALVLGVCHPTWAQELSFLAPMLKQKINTALQEERIKTVHFRIVPFAAKTKPLCPTINQTTLDADEEHCFTFMEQSSLENVSSHELRQELAKFYVRCQKRNLLPKRSNDEEFKTFL